MDLGKLEELLQLSQSVLESRSINQGYKLLLSVQITIANFLKKDFSKTLSSLNEISNLINQGAFEKIKGDKNKKYSLAFYKLITSLHPLLKKENINNYSKKIPHFGESHCLSFVHQTISLSS